MKPIILGSTSVYRQQLLQKLGIKFTTLRPSFDEESAKISLIADQASPLQIAEALSRGKAQSINEPLALVITGDQLVQLDESILGKPKNFEKAFQQLKSLNGRQHQLITAVTMQLGAETRHLNHVTNLTMKNLNDLELEMYLKKDQPYDAAGSYKIEENGLILFSQIVTDDFSAIQGLPLIWISNQLKGMGYEFFKD